MSVEAKAIRAGRWMVWAIGASAVVLAAAPTAIADPVLPVAGGGSASDAVSQLQSAGYTVSVNYLEGRPNVPLSECKVTGITTFGAAMTSSTVMMMLMEPEEFDTAYVDVACPNAK